MTTFYEIAVYTHYPNITRVKRIAYIRFYIILLALTIMMISRHLRIVHPGKLKKQGGDKHCSHDNILLPSIVGTPVTGLHHPEGKLNKTVV